MVVCGWWSVAWCSCKCLSFSQQPHGLWCHSHSKTAQSCLYELTYDMNIVQYMQLEPSLCVWNGTEMYSSLQHLSCLLYVGDEWETESLCGVGWTSVIASQWSTSYPSRVDDHHTYHGRSWLWDHSLCGALHVANTVWCAEWLWCQDSIIHWEVSAERLHVRNFLYVKKINLLVTAVCGPFRTLDLKDAAECENVYHIP